MTGEFHRAAGLLGPFYVACLVGADGKMLNAGSRLVMDSVSEHETEAEAREWLHAELTQRGVAVKIRDVTSPHMRAKGATT